MPGIDAAQILTPAVQKEAVQAARQARDQDPEHQKLRKASQAMEGFFVGMLLKKMHASESKDGLFGQSSESETWREMFDDAVAEQVAKQGTLGLGKMLYNKMADQVGAKETGEQS